MYAVELGRRYGFADVFERLCKRWDGQVPAAILRSYAHLETAGRGTRPGRKRVPAEAPNLDVFAMLPRWRFHAALRADVGFAGLCVLIALSLRADPDGEIPPQFTPGRPALARDAHLSPTGFSDGLDRLERAGLVEVKRAVGRRNRYCLLPETETRQAVATGIGIANPSTPLDYHPSPPLDYHPSPPLDDIQTPVPYPGTIPATAASPPSREGFASETADEERTAPEGDGAGQAEPLTDEAISERIRVNIERARALMARRRQAAKRSKERLQPWPRFAPAKPRGPFYPGAHYIVAGPFSETGTLGNGHLRMLDRNLTPGPSESFDAFASFHGPPNAVSGGTLGVGRDRADLIASNRERRRERMRAAEARKHELESESDF